VVCHLNFPINIVGIARCFTYGGSKNSALHDPNVLPRDNLSKEKYMSKEEKQTSINHFHEKLFKLKDMMKTEVRAELWFRSPLFTALCRKKALPFSTYWT
jgi:HD superfamily phosphodiesterase